MTTLRATFIRDRLGFGAGWAAAIALCASLPALFIPFMSDDWINLAGASTRVPLRTAFGYFRPAYLASYWAEFHIWGARPMPFHVTNILLVVACALMVVVVVRRYTGDATWAAAAGILFAIHPYHVENVAWVAARADSASTALALVALWAYDRWVRDGSGLAFGAVVAFEAALLFKESVALLPVMVILLRVASDGRIGRREWLRGILPLAGTAFLHFVVLRRIFLGGESFNALRTFGVPWIKRDADFFSAAILPVHAEAIEAHAWLFLMSALAIAGVLVFLARRALSGRLVEATASILLCAASLAPSLVSFQERYFLFPSAVSCAILAFLLLRMPKRIAALGWILISVIWLGSLITHWQGWLEAGKASEALVAGLTEASRREHVEEIVVVNQPYRVAGAPVGGDLSSAVQFSGGGWARIRAATSLNLPNASASGIEGPVTGLPLKVYMPKGQFSGMFLPLERPANTIRDLGYATLAFDERDGVTVDIPTLENGSRVAYAWHRGKLVRLF